MSERHWLDWSDPCLPQAAAWLIDRHRRAGETLCDLRHVLCIAPGRRAGRILLELLVHEAEAHGLTLLPPDTGTPASLVDLMIEPTQAVASRAEQVLAWLGVLRHAPPEVRAVVLPHPPEADDAIAWHDLAVTLCTLHDELDGEGVTHERIVAECARLDRPSEADRWRALESLHRSYLDALRTAGRIDRHRTARRSVEQCGAQSGTTTITLIGVVDMNIAQRRVVREFSKHDRVAVLVHAPADRADRFDEEGCVVVQPWLDARIELCDEWILTAARPEDQAQAVMREIAAFDGRYACDEITIGLADEALAGRMRRAADWAGLDVHSAAGRPLPRTAPFRLLQAAADWLESPRFATFAALVRHPDLERTLRARSSEEAGIKDWLSLLDRYFQEHLDERFTGAWLGDEKMQRRLATVHDAVGQLLGDLTDARPRPLNAWTRAVIGVLDGVFGWMKTDRDEAGAHETLESCVRLAETIASFEQVDDSLQPPLAAATALRLVLAHATDAALPEPFRPEQIEMLGWLELHLDPAPAALVTGFNEGTVPEAVLGDAFLPNTLRTAVGLMNNDRRYARDAYLLEALVASRRAIRLIVGRQDALGEAIAPSRLLLACDDDTLLRRSKRFFLEKEPPPVTAASIGLSPPAGQSRFVVPELPADLEPLTYLRVTDFRKYIECPYRFALERLLKLEDRDDGGAELDPLRFGGLVHRILERFGEDPAIRDTDDESVIERYLVGAMHDEARRCFGAHPPPAVLVQLARLAQRLRGFAHCQAALRRQGWRIVHSEWALGEHEVALDADDGAPPMPIHGRIDRIDRHERTGAWRIIDYKTGERGDNPYRAHHGTKSRPKAEDVEWKDLQLPLYQHLIRQSDLGIGDAVEVGYLVLPKQADRVRWHGATWNPRQLERALERAREIVRAVREGRFERSRDHAPRWDSYARICQNTVFGTEEEGEDGEGGS